MRIWPRQKIVKAADARQEDEVTFPELAEDDRSFGQGSPRVARLLRLFSIAERIMPFSAPCRGRPKPRLYKCFDFRARPQLQAAGRRRPACRGPEPTANGCKSLRP